MVIVNNQTFGSKKKNWFELLIFNLFLLLSMQYALDIQWKYDLFFKRLRLPGLVAFMYLGALFRKTWNTYQ